MTTAQAFYRKWRPQTFDEVVGQEHITQTLRNAIAAGRISHAYLFAGPRGTGKTTMARLVAKAVNCLQPDPTARPCNQCAICTAVSEGRLLDLIEIDAASNRGIEDIRELRDKIHFAPAEARFKVYVVDEVHMLTTEAFNALLKTLEEPPPHALFVLATTDPQKVPATVLSRCQRFDFRRLTLREITRQLDKLVAAEGLTAEPGALELIARHATGAMRDALSMLDQLAAYSSTITLAQAQAALGVGAYASVSAIVTSLAQGNQAGGLDAINNAVQEGADVRQLARQIIDHLRSLLLMRVGGGGLLDLTDEQRTALNTQAQAFSTPALIKALKLFNQAAADVRNSWQPQLLLELAYLEALQAMQPAPNAPAAPVSAPQPVRPPSRPAAAPAERPAVAQPPKTQAAPSAPASSGAPVALEAITAQWDTILDHVRKRKVSAQALLKSARPTALENNMLTLSWPSETLLKLYEEANTKRLIEAVIGEVMGQPISTRCIVSKPGGQPDRLVEEAVKSLGAIVSS